MALDFYSLSDIGQRQRLFFIENNDFEAMEDIWYEYKTLTGISINQYGTTRIYQDHVLLIISLINKSLANMSNKHVRLQILDKLGMAEEGLLGFGD